MCVSVLFPSFICWVFPQMNGDWPCWSVCTQATLQAVDKNLHQGQGGHCSVNLLSPVRSTDTCALISLTPHFFDVLIFVLPFPRLSSHILLRLLLHTSFSPPLLLSFLPRDEAQSYLGYAGFGELKSHLTNSVCLG